VMVEKSAEVIVLSSRIGELKDARLNYETRQLELRKDRTDTIGRPGHPFAH